MILQASGCRGRYTPSPIAFKDVRSPTSIHPSLSHAQIIAMAAHVDVPPALLSVVQRASISKIVTAVFAIIIIRLVARAFYRVYFHPLTRFQGPKIAAATRLPYLYATLTGTHIPRLKKLHERYGDIVRVAPDELSIIDAHAWKDINGHAPKGSPGSMPQKHWPRYGLPVNGVPGLISARDEDHPRMRRIFNPAFSDRALKQQEPLFLKYADLLVAKLREGIEKDPDTKFDMVRMYNFTTFDVMGDLTFGEPLHMLDNAEYDPWVKVIFASIVFGTRLGIVNHYPILRNLVRKMMPNKMIKLRYTHFQHSVTRVTKRLEKGRSSEGVDLWDFVLNQPEGKGLTRDEMDSNASLFMVAGTETTATLVSGLSYLLAKHPEKMTRLVNEIRGAFTSSDDMKLEILAALPYLNACMKEALRVYPPVASGLPRLTPAEGSTVCGVYIPPNTTIQIPNKPMYDSERNFKDALSFLPERWTGEDPRFADDKQFALQPFSYGSRDCLGKNMANHEMRLIMAKILFNFDMELCPESDGWINQDSYTLWRKPPLIMKLKAV
ncbi:cytochrome P450 [Clohesyomyces aquaticus]|uniref:Cytochrome P450 n=1 Tax=Clohesyomyces aquaticus TaxID=1231657 RepID=A0A1Y1YL78_9PLEO|nr:cytochrome P450 [Clohesyomyces aquaticus]